MKIIKFLILFYIATLFVRTQGFSQANPYIEVLPLNSGLVALGSTLDLQITIGNSGISNIPVIKLRPVITVPPLVTILPNVQQTGLPPGWSIVTNTGSQIRICNGTDVIAGSTSRTIFIKVQGVLIGGPSTFTGQINFANGVSCAVAGPTVSGNNTADDFATSTIQVVPGCSLGINAVAGTISCNSGTTTITATATAATGPVEYSITGGAPYQASNIFNNVVAGTYTVSVREVNNPTTCAVSTTLTISEPPPIPSPSVNIIQPNCTMPNGIVTITSDITGLTFSIDGGPFTAYPVAGYSLPAGSHTITAENINNCFSPTNTFIVDAQPSTPSTPIIGIITQPDCSITTGSVVLDNLPAGAWTIEPGTITGNTPTATINNLAAGSYSFTVTNSVGCSSLPTANINIIAVVGSPAAPLVTIADPTCTIATGTITITSDVTDLIFSLDAGAFLPYPTGGYTGVSSGAHTLIAQNLSGCSSPFTNITIAAQPASPTAPTVSVEQPNCTVSTGTISVTSDTAGLTFSLDGSPFAPYPVGGYIITTGSHALAVQNLSGCAPVVTNNIIVNAQPATPSLSALYTAITCFAGTSLITATASGGILPYEYSINAGLYQSANFFTVGAGSYTISVKDSNGCIGSSSVIEIIQPSQITATASASEITCNGGEAILTVVATGGSGAYEYSLNNGAYQTDNTFKVKAGTYSINTRSIIDPSCSAATITLVVSQPGILKVSATAPAIRYCGGTTEVKVTATGGTPPYTGTGNFVKGPGYWDFVVTDSKGCSSSVYLYIYPPGCVELKVFPNPAQRSITVNHSSASGTSSYLQIFSVTGEKVLTHYVPYTVFISTINISNLSNGIYIMVYVNGDEKKETRFIKITN